MEARYRMEENPDPKGSSGKKLLHPRLIPYKTYSIRELMRYGKDRSTFSEADISGALKLITDLVAETCGEEIMWRSRGWAFSAFRSSRVR